MVWVCNPYVGAYTKFELRWIDANLCGL